jgi:DNA topoisomerase VI subunit A
VRVEQQAFAKHGLNMVIEKYLPEKLAEPDKFLP